MTGIISKVVTVGSVPEKSTESRLQAMAEMFGSMRHLSPDPKRTKKFIGAASPQDLEILDDAISAFPSATPLEQRVLRSIFLPLSSRNLTTRMIFELLAHRSAFLVEATGISSLDNIDYTLEEYVSGVRHIRTPNDYSVPLDYADERTRLENIALIKFAFALDQKAPQSHLIPTVQTSIPRSVQRYARVYYSDDLVGLLLEYPERVDDLIDLSVANQISDPHLLRAYLEHEGHASLTSGVL